MSVFMPDLMLRDVTRIDKALLDANGLRGLILDVDNTLTEHGSQHIRPQVERWLLSMSEQGIRLIIVSNNTRSRVEPFAQRLGLAFVAMGCKPLTLGFSRAQSQLGLTAGEIGVVGDQIYTDVVGGNLEGMYTILVTPLLLEDKAFFKLKRSLETIHIRAYCRRKGISFAARRG